MPCPQASNSVFGVERLVMVLSSFKGSRKTAGGTRIGLNCVRTSVRTTIESALLGLRPACACAIPVEIDHPFEVFADRRERRTFADLIPRERRRPGVDAKRDVHDWLLDFGQRTIPLDVGSMTPHHWNERLRKHGK